MAPSKKEARYGIMANLAIITGILATLADHGGTIANCEDHVLEAINSAGIPGDPYTWDGVRKASTNFLFLLASTVPALPAFLTLFALTTLPLHHDYPYRTTINSNMSGRGEKWGAEGHFALLMGLYAVLREENISVARHQGLVLGAFKDQGLEDYTWEGIR